MAGSLPYFFFATRTSTNQHAIAVTVEAVAGLDGVVVCRQNVLAACESANQREQRGTRQMKVCQQTLHHAKMKSGNDEQAGLGSAGKHQIRGT